MKNSLSNYAEECIERGKYELSYQQWLTILNCYKDKISVEECSKRVNVDSNTLRLIYLELSLRVVNDEMEKIIK